MYAHVRLLVGMPEALWYEVPAHLKKLVVVGAVVRVPLRFGVQVGMVVGWSNERPQISCALKKISSLEPFPHDPHYADFIKHLAAYHHVDPLHFFIKLRRFMHTKNAPSPAVRGEWVGDQHEPDLTGEQRIVVDSVINDMNQKLFATSVLHGITGSGKTEVYKELVRHAIKENKTVIMLLPEVSLATTFERRLRKELGNDFPLVSFHSGSSAGAKRMLWQKVCAGVPQLILGVHLPPLLPITRLGLIIVDEEHDTGYQEQRYPRMNAKEAVLLRASVNSVPILLGSATPSVQTMHNTTHRGWKLFQLTKRFAGSLPVPIIVPLSKEPKRSHFWISKELETAIAERLSRREQVLLFLNRRGFCSFVQCRDCSTVISCHHCSVSLTLHDGDLLRCHYCDFAIPLPQNCSACKKSKAQFLKKGLGTQQLVTIIKSLFPHASVARADMDVTINRRKWEETITSFESGALDILVGTKTITKGYDFSRVTLVGIIWADMGINYPHYNAHEVALQQLIQVSGRAGRHRENSEVIIQTTSQHWLLDYVAEGRYREFCLRDLQSRQQLGYPPFKRLMMIEVRSLNDAVAEQDAQLVMNLLQAAVAVHAPTALILGPAMPPVHRIQSISYRVIYLKTKTVTEAALLYRSALADTKFESEILFMPALL